MRILLKLLLIAGFIAPSQVLAFAASVWDEGDFSKARLVSSHQSVPLNDEELYLGLHIKMDPDWKTYWRSPGNAGLPPVIDWEGSINLGSAEIEYPAPHRFEIFDLQTYGYPDEVIYPIRIEPAVEGAPIYLRAHVNYLVCKDLCVPVTAKLELEIPPAIEAAPYSLEAGLIEQYLKQVPEKDGKNVELSEVRILGQEGLQNLVFKLRGKNIMTGADIIVEDLEYFKFGIPKRRILSASNEAEFVIPVKPVGSKQDIEGQKVNITLMDGWGNLDEREIILETHKGD